MKKLFYIGILGIILFEFFKVYFIMPMPGSQAMRSIDVAYFLHSYRWAIRGIFVALMIAGITQAYGVRHKWIALLLILVAVAVIFLFNFKMTADSMFKQPEKLSFDSKTTNTLNDSSVIVGVTIGNYARAYPIRYLVYHHQVQDSIGDKKIIVTYCSVCRTGRVFEPIVNKHYETFRLVGMDHFNAMFEDASTGSWWRQVNGEAIVGPLSGQMLPEVESTQTTLRKWFDLYPDALVMKLDEASKESYDSLGRYERGKSKGNLTQTDSASWHEKSWVVGVQVKGKSKAYDWNLLKEKRILHDVVAENPIVIILAEDNESFNAFERLSPDETFTISHDTIRANNQKYDFSGRDLQTPSSRLKKVQCYQEFWHSWRTFHPDTEKFN